MIQVNSVFKNLDEWRHLPNYQLERRADIFFSLYLVEALWDCLKIEAKKRFVPEFPLKRRGSNRSCKVDYVAVTKNGAELVLVELKTDGESIRAKQLEYLLEAAEAGPRKILEWLAEIKNATSAKDKYEALFGILGKMGLAGVVSAKLPERCRVVLILPNEDDLKDKEKVLEDFKKKRVTLDLVSFENFEKTVAKHQDSLSQNFAVSLEEWRTNPV